MQLQADRGENPYLTCDTCIINVILPPSVLEFSHDDFLKDVYKFGVLSGQHISTADQRLINTKYKGMEAAKIPPGILYKETEIFVNLSQEECTLLVGLANSKKREGTSYLDRVCIFDV